MMRDFIRGSFLGVSPRFDIIWQRLLFWVGRHAKRLPESIKRPLRCIKFWFVPYDPIAITPEQSAALLREVLCYRTSGGDVIVFPVIDWHFRIQRPQHLARELAARGHRVFYLATSIGHSKVPGFRFLESPAPGVFICQLTIPGRRPDIYRSRPQGPWMHRLLCALDELRRACDLKSIVSIVDSPFWHSLARALPGNHVIYDCMDYHAGFSTNSPEILELESSLLNEADLVVTTSMNLKNKIEAGSPNLLIRNGAEVSFFKKRPSSLAYQAGRPVIGYFGAISEWFDLDLVVAAALAFPDWDFVLVGSTYLCDTTKARRVTNIKFTGEVPYRDLPGYLHAFDVCMIPFKLNELTLCTNPVKVYEYMAAGKPVVSTALPELELISEHIHVAAYTDDFIRKLALAMEEAGDAELASRRMEWASCHDWSSRAQTLDEAIKGLCPRVSVVLLTYNNLQLTRQCLESLEQFTCYPNWELIIVDNASTDGTPDFLRSYESEKPWVRVLLNEENLGFAAGNNVGLRAATGEYLILLNNDTYVTEGWMVDLIRHLRRNQDLGLVGPVTNNIGNEAKIDISYSSMEEMAEKARKYTLNHARNLLYLNNLGFFCVAMPRKIYESVGGLDEEFRVGFFEDDDYCNRVRQIGLKIAIAEDVFVHHHLSAAFSKIKEAEKRQIFEKNKTIYERKWGAWIPHKYRDEKQIISVLKTVKRYVAGILH